MNRASLQTGPGGLAAPNSSRATSSNATNELGGSHQLVNDFCWVIQQIQYQLGLLNNLEISNHFIGSRSDEQPLSQEYSPSVNNSPAQKQFLIAKQPHPQKIEQDIINCQSASSNLTNPQMKPDEPNPDPRAFSSHELSSQSHNPSPGNFPSTQSKIIGSISPVPKNAFPIPKVPVTKGWTNGAHQGAASSCFQGRPDEWYKNHFPPIKKDTDNVK
ncbi:hypothetical protein DSO57_1001015 [Entomophthora muscae]|uniref:Uncharacterized protein n=1 Tax=Entomophthora muscae TaxID=34485 RepID=A0ACC2UUW3_9FUNG|nr:hypothetical protein DSO57_1001015 [Entomophthora muscae]